MDYLDVVKNDKLILPKNIDIPALKKWVKDVTEANQRQIDIVKKEESRKTGRSGKTFTPPEGSELESNFHAYLNEKNELVEGYGSSLDSMEPRQLGVPKLLWAELKKHGRETMDELIDNFRGLPPEFLVLFINYMVISGHLKKYKEEDGTETIEMVSDDERIEQSSIESNKKPQKQIEDLSRRKPKRSRKKVSSPSPSN